MRLVIRVDAGSEIGGGHVMRGRAVAEALARRGWQAVFVARPEYAADVKTLCGAFEVVPFDASANCEAEAIISRIPEGCDALLVDHYGLGAEFEARCRHWARQVVVIEDFPNRDHACDILIDPTAGREPDAYARRNPEIAQCLTGPHYAPLRAQFTQARWKLDRAAQDDERPRRVLVALGATDPANVTDTALSALDALVGPLEIEVVLSSRAAHKDEVARRVGAMRHDTRFHLDVEDMAALMKWADFAIGAGGSGAWERCCLGLPTIALQLADNQREVLEGLWHAGAATIPAALDADAIRDAAAALMDDSQARGGMAQAGRKLCDGLGAERIAIALEEPVRAADGAPVRLRPAEDRDVLILLAWQRDPETRRYARVARVPSESEHRRWFAEKLVDPNCIFQILEHKEQPAGFVRLDRIKERGGFEVSIGVAPEKRGIKIARGGLALIRRLLPECRLLAYVNPENEASLKLFAAAGYRPGGERWYVSEAGGNG